MARPTSRPRLSQIDPTRLAEEIEQLVLDHLRSHVMRVDLRADLAALPQDALDLRHAVRALAAYARGEHDLDAPVEEYLKTVGELLWIRPIDGPIYRTPELDDALTADLDQLDDDPVGRLLTVLVAAVGRSQIASRRRLTVAQLAALASISPDHVRLLAREGRIPLEEREGALSISAACAANYLKEKHN